MKTESEIIIALEELKSAYQLRLKNIETAITCISTASMIVDAVKTCHVKQLKRKLNAASVAPVTPVEVKNIDSKALIPPLYKLNKMQKNIYCARNAERNLKRQPHAFIAQSSVQQKLEIVITLLNKKQKWFRFLIQPRWIQLQHLFLSLLQLKNITIRNS